MAKFIGVVATLVDGKHVSYQEVTQNAFPGFEGALRDAAGQAAYEAGVAAGIKEWEPDPQQPEANQPEGVTGQGRSEQVQTGPPGPGGNQLGR